jgi:pSer/pThr/pTyr-binding forkhead associated (FHA) protein
MTLTIRNNETGGILSLIEESIFIVGRVHAPGIVSIDLNLGKTLEEIDLGFLRKYVSRKHFELVTLSKNSVIVRNLGPNGTLIQNREGQYLGCDNDGRLAYAGDIIVLGKKDKFYNLFLS